MYNAAKPLCIARSNNSLNKIGVYCFVQNCSCGKRAKVQRGEESSRNPISAIINSRYKEAAFSPWKSLRKGNFRHFSTKYASGKRLHIVPFAV